ncbi:Uma2 family endonuclease [Fodinicola feengrottensis]|uniref:Uma2 family endonuclease n=1 Tax=Fodinicola feengrottensis TaxID=435914 RepID=UPI002442C899|nr:Uma2 family endonuclease [Fodinicola feengrottensis]
MTALPVPEDQLAKLLTVAEYAALPQNALRPWELQEGILFRSPRPGYDHVDASLELAIQIKAQLPGDLWVMQDASVDLELAAPDEPGFVRAPDLFIVERAVRDEVRRRKRLIRAAEVLLAVEIISPGSKRMDLVVKRAEYADAGIGQYWIIDLDPPTSLTACHLTEGFGYMDGGTVTGKYEAALPVPLVVDLDRLC